MRYKGEDPNGSPGPTDHHIHRPVPAVPRWSFIFLTRHAAIAALAVAALVVPDAGGPRLALLLAGAVLPFDLALHWAARRRGRVPLVAAYGDQFFVALVALLFSEVWQAVLLIALADLALMTLLFGRRTAAASALVAAQALAVVAAAVQPPDALLGLVSFLVAAPTLILTVGAVAEYEQRTRHRYTELVESMDSVIWEADPKTLRFTYVSPRASELLGYPLAAWYDDPDMWAKMLHPQDREQVLRATLTAILEGQDLNITHRMITAHGGSVWVQDVMRVEVDASGDVVQLRGELSDITKRVEAEIETAARSRQWFALAELGRHAVEGARVATLFEASVTLIAQALDVELVSIYEALPDDHALVMAAGVGWKERGFSGRVFLVGWGSELDAALVHDEPLVIEDVRSDQRFQPSEPLRSADARSGICIPIPARDGRNRVLAAYSRSTRRFAVEEVQFLQAMARALGEAIARRNAEAALRHEALHDSLTGLANRTLFYDRLAHALAAARRSRSPVAVVLLDVDRFKEVNDTLGHHCGDLLLQDIAGRLRAVVREEDTLARLGGDEFAIVLTQMADPGVAVLVAERILAALDAPFRVRGVTIHVTASIGIAICPEHGEDVESLVQCADIAMYSAKPKRGGYAIYTAEYGPQGTEHLELLSDLRSALDADELVLHFQPKIDLRSGHVSGAEALVRWRHPTFGLVPPGRFIQLAETAGLIQLLTERVVELGARQCRQWLDAGLDMHVAVNVSVFDLYDDRIVEVISRALERHELSGHRLTLEITENEILDDLHKASRILERLHEMGVRLSVDDFGTGYSSLAYLKQLPIDEIKIDREFIADIGTDAADAAIVRSIVDLSHQLGLEVVAEGVETREVLEQVSELSRCDLAQGYHISHPLPSGEIAEWLRSCPWPVPRTERVA